MSMYEQVQKGKQEEVLNEMIETLNYQRNIILQHFKAVYCRFTPLSPCHKARRRGPVE